MRKPLMLYSDELIAVFPSLVSGEDSRSGTLGPKGVSVPSHKNTRNIFSLDEVTVRHTDKLALTRSTPPTVDSGHCKSL